MSIGELVEKAQSLTLNNIGLVPFCPLDRGFKLSPIPRYLFRVYSPNSDGSTDHEWVKSRDAVAHLPTANRDIFGRRDQHAAANEAYGHLDWKNLNRYNLMSWTSSLLFAIEYMFYRHSHYKDRSDLEEIKLCIIDTHVFDHRAFICDKDLIKAFAPLNEDLTQFCTLRETEYYFGEYLSQGALMIRGNCVIVSAQDMIDAGLLTLRDEVRKSCGANARPLLAKDVVQIRNAYPPDSWASPVVAWDLINVAINIGRLFGPTFHFPFAVNLVATLPGRLDAHIVAEAFAAQVFEGEERETFLDASLGIVAHQIMPELMRARDIACIVYAESRQSQLEDSLKDAEACIERAVEHLMDLNGLSDYQQYIRFTDSLKKAQKVRSLINGLEGQMAEHLYFW